MIGVVGLGLGRSRDRAKLVLRQSVFWFALVPGLA